MHGMNAIADGGWFGVGLGQGRLKWGWLPNGNNDFIFAVIAEELGVVGCFVVLVLLAVLACTRLRMGAAPSRDGDVTAPGRCCLRSVLCGHVGVLG
jgi:cell division protein FtsW (lipid II flippase)